MSNLADTYFLHVHPLAISLIGAQAIGVKIDLKARDELCIKVRARLNEYRNRINAITGKDFNPNSPKQVKELIYDTMHLPAVYKDKRITTDEEAVLKLHKQYPDESVLNLIINYRKDSKLLSTFLEVKLGDDGRIRTSYNVSGTGTFRISSSQDLWKEGANLQNIPTGKRPGVENLRHLFVADDGCELTKGDLVQAEAIVVSRILCRYGDSYVWDKYNTVGFDIHRWAASTIFNIPESDVTKLQRDIGKIRVHAGNYVAGPSTIISTALKWGVDGVDYPMAKRIIDSGHRSMPGLRRWWNAVEKTIRATRTLYTCLGRRRFFFGRADGSDTIRTAVSFEPQSTVGDVCNTMFRRLYFRCIELGLRARPVLQIHDEVVVHHPLEEHDIVRAEIKKASIVPLDLNGDIAPLIIPVEIKSGPNWKDMV